MAVSKLLGKVAIYLDFGTMKLTQYFTDTIDNREILYFDVEALMVYEKDVLCWTPTCKLG